MVVIDTYEYVVINVCVKTIVLQKNYKNIIKYEIYALKVFEAVSKNALK